MDLKHARTFVTIADLGTVSKAALRLRVAQPALSRQLSDFEQEMGLKLFDRVGRRLLLTSGGSELLADCRALLNCGDAIADHARQLQAGSSGLLKIAASPQHVESVIAGLLPKFAKSFPDVQVSIREGSGREMLDMLERGEIHFAQNLLHDLRPDPALFELAPLSSVNLLAACRQGLMLGPDETIEVEKLAGKPLLLLDIGFGFRRAFDAAARLAQLEPRIRFEKSIPALPTRTRGSRRRGGDHSVSAANRPIQAVHPQSGLSGQAFAARPLRPVGQAPATTHLRDGIPRDLDKTRS